MIRADFIQFAYLISAVLFIFGLKGLTHPRTAVRGNMTGAIAMLIAVVAVLLQNNIIHFGGIVAGLVLGAAIGVILAIKIQMAAMPQLVAIFNGFGGAASALVAAAEYRWLINHNLTISSGVAIAAAALIGSVALTGSIVAFAKLQELIGSKPWKIPAKIINGLLLAVSIGLCIAMIVKPTMLTLWMLIGVASLLGITLVLPIGGADMPVVIALLNSYSGLAAAAAGFILKNAVLIIAGSLVGASGLILTAIMCRAMNRSLANVMFAGVGGDTHTSVNADEIYAGKIKSTAPEEVAMILESASRVAFVPGYGMAVAQAQHAVRDLMNLLEAREIHVEFAIHPVAGRMPGHMNVLLAESDVPYDRLIEMEQINPTFDQVDVAIVLGANDVVNPSARNDPQSPIAGMPIVNVDKARTIIVVKRSLSPGFAGIPNPLFAAENTLMLFGDGKKMIIEIGEALKEAS